MAPSIDYVTGASSRKPPPNPRIVPDPELLRVEEVQLPDPVPSQASEGKVK